MSKEALEALRRVQACIESAVVQQEEHAAAFAQSKDMARQAARAAATAHGLQMALVCVRVEMKRQGVTYEELVAEVQRLLSELHEQVLEEAKQEDLVKLANALEELHDHVVEELVTRAGGEQ